MRGKLAMIPGFLAAIGCATVFLNLTKPFLLDPEEWVTRLPLATVVQLLWVIPLDRWAAARSYCSFQTGLRFGARVILYITIIPYGVMVVLAFWLYLR